MWPITRLTIEQDTPIEMPSPIERANRVVPTAVGKLSLGDLPLIVGIVFRTVKVIALQNRTPIPDLIRAFDARPRREVDGGMKLAHVRWLTDGLLHVLFGGAYCMKRTLILFHYARRYGLDPRVVFGVAKDDETLKGHAWLELDGVPYQENEGALDGFKVIYAHPGDHRAEDKRKPKQ